MGYSVTKKRFVPTPVLRTGGGSLGLPIAGRNFVKSVPKIAASVELLTLNEPTSWFT